MRLNAAIAGFAAVMALSSGADYVPENWNREARRKFADCRFGIFIHWGLYSAYAQGEWYQQDVCLDTETYGRIKDGFYPSKFNAKEWVRVFKDAGAKYVTITSRHHDGFSLWPTKVDDGFNISNTPFKRDVLGELAVACREEGLQLNFYYSLMDWHRSDYPAGKTARAVFGEQKGDYASYKRFMMAQISELIDWYRPGVIWFDGEWEHVRRISDGKTERTLDWEFDDIYDLIHRKKVLVANNNHLPMRPKEDVQLFERDLPGENKTGFSAGQTVVEDRPIEQCDVIQKNVWGYRIKEREFRSAPDVVRLIVRAAAKDSNLLVNIGPDASGRLPAKAVEVMRDVGVWMRENGYAVYGSRGGGFSKDGGTAYTRKHGVTYAISWTDGTNSMPRVSTVKN